LTWDPAVPVDVSRLEGVDFLEVDSVRWLEGGLNEATLGKLARVCRPKVVRGFAVGGSLPPEPAFQRHLKYFATSLDASWVTLDLAFERASSSAGEDFDTGIRLPPRQTAAAARLAARSAASLIQSFGRPAALTGIQNYLKPRRDEMPDGEFLAQVVDESGCGIVLDLATLWINAANGRQPVASFLDQIPLDRVWAIRLGRGNRRSGYGFGAKPGEILPPLLDVASSLLPRLSDLRAILLDVQGEGFRRRGSQVLDQLGLLRSLWAHRGTNAPEAGGAWRRTARCRPESPVTPREWETVLGGLVVGKDLQGPLAEDLHRDPGLAAVRRDLSENRAARIERHLLLTSRLVAAAEGPAFFRAILEAHWRRETPLPSAPLEALRFARHLASLALDIPYLDEILEYEKAVVASEMDGEKRVVSFQHDPEVVLRAVARGRFPDGLRPGLFQVEVATA
jgi:uncharacterized protein (UPF0276 family)